MRVVVPFDATGPKSRLDDSLVDDERAAFARAMLRDVLDAVRAAGRTPEVLATEPVDVDAAATVDDRPLTPAVNAVLRATDGPVAVVMADLGLATPAALRRLFDGDPEGRDGDDEDCRADLVLVPGRGGGTNAFVARHPEFRVDYHGTSYLDHLEIAAEIGASVREVDSYRLSTDVDERADLPELLLHGDGRATAWLREQGFRLDVTDGRVGVVRE